jgi:hypothetical protein
LLIAAGGGGFFDDDLLGLLRSLWPNDARVVIFRPHAPHLGRAVYLSGRVMQLVSWMTSLLRAHGFRLKEFIAVIASGAILGWLIWLATVRIFPQPLALPELYSVFAAPLFPAIFFLDMVVFAIITTPPTGDEDREWWSCAAA